MFECKIEIRYYETDMQGIVHHSNYLRYLEIAREKLSRKEFNMGTMDFDELGVFYVIREAETKFIYPIRFGDELSIRISLIEYTGLKLVHTYELYVGETLCATCRTLMVSIDKHSFKPMSMRKKFPELHKITNELLIKHSVEV